MIIATTPDIVDGPFAFAFASQQCAGNGCCYLLSSQNLHERKGKERKVTFIILSRPFGQLVSC
jgi:hypothetical protein